MNKKLKINELFHSIQGEGRHAGLPCSFVRLTGCNLRCSYCDTEYAFHEGREMLISDIISALRMYDCKLVQITGGEPLMQKNVHSLIEQLLDEEYKILLETGGSLDIINIDERVHIVMDLKTPSSRMMKKNLFKNIDYIKRTDEIKFVISDRDDFDWSIDIIDKFNLINKAEIVFSPSFGIINTAELAEWILKSKLNIRLQLQLHKYIWKPDKRGV